MEEKFVLSSTSKDRHHTNFSKEMLEEGVSAINSESKMRYLVGHRREYPLLGYFDDAEIVEEKDVYLLKAARKFYATKGPVNWDKELVAEYPEHPVQFRRRDPVEKDLVVTLDPNNFGSPKNYINFQNTFRAEFKSDVILNNDTRKGLIPDPRIIIGLVTVGPLWTITKPFIKKIGEKIAEDIGDGIYEAGKKQLASLVDKVTKIIKMARQEAVPKDKPLSMIFELHGELYVELHAKTDNADLVAKGLSIRQLTKMRLRLSELQANVKIAEAHFDLSEKGSWKFTYLITEDGVQIGKPTIFKKRDKLVERIKLSPTYGHSVGAGVTYDYSHLPENTDESQS